MNGLTFLTYILEATRMVGGALIGAWQFKDGKKLDLKVKDLTVKAREIVYIPPTDTVAVNKLTNNGLIRVDGKLIARKINNNGTIDNNGVVEIW